jgi:hypothetical protein
MRGFAAAIRDDVAMTESIVTGSNPGSKLSATESNSEQPKRL